MYTELSTRLYLAASSTEYSRPIGIGGMNAVSVDMTVFAVTGGSVTVSLEGSNDLQNWSTITEIIGAQTSIGYASGTYGDADTERIGFKNLRLKYIQAAGGDSIVAAGLNVFSA